MQDMGDHISTLTTIAGCCCNYSELHSTVLTNTYKIEVLNTITPHKHKVTVRLSTQDGCFLAALFFAPLLPVGHDSIHLDFVA
jgi:hypothetical protein